MILKKYLNTIVIFLLVALLTSCKENPKMNLLDEVLLPKPVLVKATGSSFELKNNTKILIKGDSEELLQIGKYLANLLKPATGFKIEVKTTSKKTISNSIYLVLTKLESNYGEEGYHLNITDKNIIIKANSVKGIFRGIQTLRQVFPSEIEALNPQNRKWFIASGEIYDYPQFKYRGAMLDVSRHFFKKEDVKKYIDMIAMYKLNVLHLHLSDDQGWRIEIKSWPNLTTYGGSTQVGGGKGGFYTQEDYKEIVKYAQERYITIIPEIDMPGHTNAALASYPELNCDGKATKLYTGMKVGFSTLCTHKKITYQFIDDVIRELAAITPGPYIHIGGDESHSTKIEDYVPFINKVQDLVIAHGKQAIGWDEIVSAAIKPTTTVQYWGRPKNALKGVSKNAKIILSPSDRTYLDMKYDSITKLGLKWAGYVDLDKAYNWNPSTLISGITKKDILGIESPLWTETVTNMEEVEFMAFPRIIGHAEIGWTPDSLRVWDDYKMRLKKHAKRLKIMKINFYPSTLIDWNESESKE
ncbi:family 20 glycosylhydrolase [Lutibacter sp.]|uniref:family 20 glycosylhydrolase n=1 Tax=Lutibacter sp. TaxID=1925666 RepID=UPI0025C61E7C|nr:family 20 glycosylhydrolase [Lutibacter sp.]MCF6167547.1 beta-N-acetylhexosaminidase [Lutibacter sp.]